MTVNKNVFSSVSFLFVCFVYLFYCCFEWGFCGEGLCWGFFGGVIGVVFGVCFFC